MKNIVSEIYGLNRLVNKYVYNGFDPKPYLNMSQFQIIVYLLEHEKEDVCQKDLEKETHLKKATITACLDSMEELGYIRRIQSKIDRRRNNIVLTDYVMKIKNDFAVREGELNKRLISDIDEKDLDTFYRVADTIRRNISTVG